MNSTNNKLTYFDTLVTSQNLQLAKAVIPYIGRGGGMIAIYVKFMELQNAIRYANSPKLCGTVAASESDKPYMDSMGLINELKNYLGDDMVETLEMIMSLMEMMKENPDTQEDMFSNCMEVLKDIM